MLVKYTIAIWKSVVYIEIMVDTGSAERPPVQIEVKLGPETNMGRLTAIQTVNEVYSAFSADIQSRNLLGRLNRGESLSSDEKQDIIDFQIAQAGRKLLTGDQDFTLDSPDSFKNEFTDPKTGEKFRVNEGMPVEGLIRFIDRKIEAYEIVLRDQPDNSSLQGSIADRLKRLKAQRNILINNSTPYSEAQRADENPTLDHARKEQEAYWISNDPLRKTFSQDNNWYQAEWVLKNRREFTPPPKIETVRKAIDLMPLSASWRHRIRNLVLGSLIAGVSQIPHNTDFQQVPETMVSAAQAEEGTMASQTNDLINPDVSLSMTSLREEQKDIQRLGSEIKILQESELPQNVFKEGDTWNKISQANIEAVLKEGENFPESFRQILMLAYHDFNHNNYGSDTPDFIPVGGKYKTFTQDVIRKALDDYYKNPADPVYHIGKSLQTKGDVADAAKNARNFFRDYGIPSEDDLKAAKSLPTT